MLQDKTLYNYESLQLTIFLQLLRNMEIIMIVLVYIWQKENAWEFWIWSSSTYHWHNNDAGANANNEIEQSLQPFIPEKWKQKEQSRAVVKKINGRNLISVEWAKTFRKY